VLIDDPRVILTAANLRDLGGLPTSDGSTVRTGCLFRSGHLCDLDDAGLSVVGALGVRTIVDLRRPVEIAERPHPDLPGAEVVHCQVSDDDNEFAVVANMLDDAEGTIDGPTAVEDYFRRNVDGRLDAYRPVFRLATDPARLPLLFNCTAGKDRTGFVAAVLLRLLGVDEATVLGDYLLTNEVRRPWLEERENLWRRTAAAGRGIDPTDLADGQLTNLRALLWCQPSFLEASFAAVTDGWGSWEAFRRDGLGMDDERFDAFRDALLA
jgi:protein-tyrosine phosphatase